MRYALIGCEVFCREFWHAAALSPAVIDISLLPQGLHSIPGTLRENVQAEIDRVESADAGQGGTPAHTPRNYDAILIGYGLCSNGVAGVEARRTRLVIPRAHDCITLLLGSNEAYEKHFAEYPGTYWYSNGWIERALQPGPQRHAELLAHYTAKYNPAKAEALMLADREQYASYRHAAYIDWGFPAAERDREYTKQCAEFMGWEYREVPGDQSLMVDFLAGKWDNKRFLTAAPGETISPDHGGCILKAAGAQRKAET